MVLYKKPKSKRNILTTFGVAMSSLFIATDMNAEILEITWNGGHDHTTVVGTTMYPALVNIDQIIGSFGLDDLSAFTSFISNSKTVASNPGVGVVNPDISFIAGVSDGRVLSPSTFTGGSAVGSGFVGLRMSNGNVGWFRLSFALGIGFGTGEYGSEGESLTVPIMGDVNCDGLVNLLDVQPFVDLLTSGDFSVKADFSGDNAVTLLDIDPFVEALTGN